MFDTNDLKMETVKALSDEQLIDTKQQVDKALEVTSRSSSEALDHLQSLKLLLDEEMISRGLS